MELEAWIEDPPVLAGTGAFQAALRLVHELSGDGFDDLLLPAPAGPATGGPAPSGARGPMTGGIALGEDYSQWHYWWSLNLDRYLGLRDAIHSSGATTYSDAFFMGAGKVAASDTLRPTDAEVHRSVLPLLNRMLTATDDRDIVTACMVALAKYGQDHENFQLLPLFRAQLSRKNRRFARPPRCRSGSASKSRGSTISSRCCTTPHTGASSPIGARSMTEPARSPRTASG